MRVGDFFRRLFTRRERAESEKKILDLQAKIEAIEKRRQQIERDYEASRRTRREIVRRGISERTPTKASHQDISRFFKGKGGRMLPSHRRAITQRL